MKIFTIRSQNSLNDEQFLEFLNVVEEDYQKKIQAYRFWEDRKRSLLGQLLARYAIMQALSVDNNAIKILQNRYGKPYLKGYDNIQYNISHSGVWVVCAVSPFNIGIDVQEHKGAKSELASHFFSPQEKEFLFSLQKDAQKTTFYDMWSLKEAYIKAIGKGLFQPLDEFSVVKEEGGFRQAIRKNEEETYFFKQYQLEKNYSLAVCSQEQNFCPGLEELTIDDLKLLFQKS
ncbi:4'-phosphopantetheinyl transferase family protein [Streptococcus macacae]|uniref:4'-phosphopantetheinyl transferase family protein n=1 Tax=Streptococcus macacae NCTC 11558 TaxID=764298 RepID=G5JVJ4_9STRE|nr:4'-phosphopantetheinyl transferase superfamily protein [Streptococcus macacae]EHJ53231.1 4'-phosphopantetheinyl transferase family protein [Streptococcus macacae NCTC 11558]SUN78588.1 phosphopantetheinyl transferase [Streptococcus macacae NCTC 11558]